MSERPGLAHERGHAPADGEIHPFYVSCLDGRAESVVSEKLVEDAARSAEHTSEGEGETIALFALDQLTVEKIVSNMPVVSSCPLRTKPDAEVGGDGIEVAAKSVAGEGGDAIVF